MGRDDHPSGGKLVDWLQRGIDHLDHIYRAAAVTVAETVRRGIALLRTCLSYGWQALCWLYGVLEEFGHRRKQELDEMPEMVEVWQDDAEDARRLYDTVRTPVDTDGDVGPDDTDD
jgi:hypothetical protein